MIQITDLSFGYKRKQPILKELNLNLNSGSIYGLFGMNGAGKTTLLRHMAGVLFAQKGRCEISGISAAKRLPSLLADMFVIPEEFVLPPVKISKFVNLNSPFYPLFDNELLGTYLNGFEISESKKLNTFSYGQKKKFLIAFGLATQSKLLLMDEPTNGLDIPSKSQFRRIIASVATSDKCIVISTHQVRDLASLIDHIIILDDGRIIFQHSVEDISRKLAFVKVKEDSTEGLLYSEEVLGGKTGIAANTGHDTAIDLELLFNGVVKDPNAINSVLQ